MLRCLCLPCVSRFYAKPHGAAESKEQPAGPSFVTSTVPDMTTARTGTVNIHAENTAQLLTMMPVTVSGLTSGPSLSGTSTVYVPICSPFSTPQTVGAGVTELSSASKKAGVEAQKPVPEPALAPGKRTSLTSLTSADGSRTTLNPAASSSSPTLFNQFASTFSSCDQQPPSQSPTLQASLPAGTSTSTLSLQPSTLLPGHLFFIQQATSSSQSAGVGTPNPSLPTLPANVASHTTHLSTGASARSDMGTEATVRLPGELPGVPAPAAFLASETSTTRLVEYLSHESMDTGVGTATASTLVNSNSTAKPLGAGTLASASAFGSSAVGCASGLASKRTAHLRAGVSPTSAPSSSFSLFGALQAFVEQQQGSDVASPSATGSQGAVAAHGQVQVQGQGQGQGALGDHFHGFDRSALGNDNLDAPTATLSRMRPGGASLGRPSRSAAEGNRARRSNGALRDSAGAILQASSCGRGDRGNRRGSIEWLQPQAGIGPESDAGNEANTQEGIIIGGGCMGSMGSSGNAVIRARVSGPGASGLAAAASSSRASRASTTGDDMLGIFGGGRALSGPHSFEGMTSLLTGPTHTFFMDDSKGAGGHSGAGLGGNGSDTDGSRTDHAMSLVSGGQRGSVAGRAMRMHRRAERRDFLLAARSISAVLQDVQILSVLGAGAHGKVYKGALKDRFVAVKVIVHDTDVPSVIPASSLMGIKHVPSNSSLGGVAGSVGCPSGVGLADADAATPRNSSGTRTAANRALFAFGRSGLDISHGSGSEVMLGGGAAVVGSHGGVRRGASGSGVRPAVHPLRYQRAGSSNLHVLPLTMPGAVDAGSQGLGVASLPVLSLPGMQPVVMPHKHMLEGLISASAQHPNIVETYRIVTQLLNAPSMPAFVVSRGSHSPLWETTNITQAAMLKLANGSVGSGAQKATLDSAALGAGSVCIAGAAGSGMGQGPAQCQPHGMVGVAQGMQDRLQRTGSSQRSPPPVPATTQMNTIAGSGRNPVATRPAHGLIGPCCSSAAPTADMPASPFKGLEANEAMATAEVDGRYAVAPKNRGPLKVKQRPETSCAVGGSFNGSMADNGARATPQAIARNGCSEACNVKNSMQHEETDKQKHYLAEVRAAGQGSATSGIDTHMATAQRDSLLNTDGMRSGLTGALDAEPGSISSAVPLRENSTLSVSTLVRDVGSSGRITGPGTLLGVGENIPTRENLKLPSGDGLLEPGRKSSSSGEVVGQAAMALTGMPQPERTSLDLGSRSSFLSTGAAIVSASGLAQGDREAEVRSDLISGSQADDGDGSKQGGSPDHRDGQESAGRKGDAGAGLLQQPEATGRQQESKEEDPEGVYGEGVHAGDLAAVSNSRGVAGDQDPDSAELILDMLGAQAAAQRTASFLQRRQQQQQQQQQHAVQECHRNTEMAQGAIGSQAGQPTPLCPGLPESLPWCLPSDGGPDEDIVGILRQAARSTWSVGGLGSGPAIASKASGMMSEVASGSALSSTRTAGMDMLSGDLPGTAFDYIVAEDSGQLLAHAENFDLSTALFSTYRNSFVPTGYGGVSGRPYHRPLQLLRGSQSSVGGGGNHGASRAQIGSIDGGGGGGGGSDDTGAGPGTPGHSQPQAKEPALLHQEESAASIGSLHVMEASLALPPPLQAPALPPGLPSPGAVGSGASPSAWLPTIDELTVGVSADPRQNSLPGCALMTGRSSAGSTARNSLLRTASLGSGEQGVGGAGGGCFSTQVASSIGGGATRTSHGSGTSMTSGAGTQNRVLLTSNPTSAFGGQLMPVEVQYDKLSWSNHTHTSASTSANAMLNSGFTALLSSNNTLMTGGGSTLGGGGGGGHIPSGLGNWRRGDSMGVGGAAGFRRVMTAGNTPGGTERLNSNNGDGTVTVAPPSGTGPARGGAVGIGGNGGSRSAARQADPAHNENVTVRDLRSFVVEEPLSQSFTDPRSSRGAVGARRRALTTTRSHAMPWGNAQAVPGRERWQVLIVQELCTRGNLRDAILAGAFHSSNSSAGTQVIAMRHLLDTAAEIASAMAYLHSRAIVHGDLKTANVLLQRHDSDARGFIAKLADFGLARQLGARGAEDGLLVSRIGTVTHMAPETIRDNMMLLGSDVYSFGVILWELYCAQQPFANYSAFQLLSAVVQYDERPQFPAHCPAAYAMLAVRCMAKTPRERPTFAEVYKELIAIRDELFGGSGDNNSSGAGPGQVLGSTLTVPLAQARREATRVLQSHLQALSGPNPNQGSAHGSGILQCDATQNSDVTSGALREVDTHESAALHSSESWDEYNRGKRVQT